MILYHGSNVVVSKPLILEPSRLLDFGNGFYTTTNKSQAENFALKVASRRGGKAIVNVYELDENFADIKMLGFDSPNEKWLDFVSDHRNGIYDGEEYDLIYGPVANDDVYRTLQTYLVGLLTKQQALETLKVKKLYDQYVFVTNDSLKLLKFLDYAEVK